MSSAVVTSGGAAEGELKASLLQDGEQPSGGGVNDGGAAVDTEGRRGRSSNWALACMRREFDHSAGIWVILLLELVAEASRGMVLPSMSSFITGPMGLSVKDVGTAVALFSAGRFCASLGLGWLSTRAAFRRVMVGALVAGMAGNLLYAITASSTPALLFLGRLLVGFSSGTLSVSRSALAAASSSETRLRVMAHLGAARFIGYALTPGLAVILQAAGTSTSNPFNLFRLPGWILVVADALVVVALFRYLPLEFGKHEEEVEEDPTVAALKALQAQGAMDAPQQPATAAVMAGEAAAARSRSGTGASMSSISSLEATNSAVHSPNPAGGAASSPAGVRNEHRLSSRSTSSMGSRRRSSVSSLSSIKRASINSIASLVPPPPPPTSQDSKLVGRLRMGAVLGLFLCVNLLSRGVLSLMEAVGSRMYDKVIGDSDGDLQSDVGEYFLILGLIGFVVFLALPVIRRRKVVSEEVLLSAGLACTVVGSLLFVPSSPGKFQYILGSILIWSLGSSMTSTVSVTVFSRVLGRRPQGLLMGIYGAAGSIGRILFPIVGDVNRAGTLVLSAVLELACAVTIYMWAKGRTAGRCTVCTCCVEQRQQFAGAVRRGAAAVMASASQLRTMGAGGEGEGAPQRSHYELAAAGPPSTSTNGALRDVPDV